MTDPPITPPPELVDNWLAHAPNPLDRLQYVATQAARWGADQELEACCALIQRDYPNIGANALRAARRPKPPSLKAQALRAIGRPSRVGEARVIEHREHELIRRALEALDD